MSACKASILVVDSNPESLFTMAAVLIARDHIVKTAASAVEAIEIASNCTLDLLIADFALDGLEEGALLHEVRDSPGHADLPVMFLTENQSTDVIRRNHEYGAAFHLKKPIDPMVLGELVDKALWMPHLVSAHVQQKVVRTPHISFANNPFDQVRQSAPVVPGIPITF